MLKPYIQLFAEPADGGAPAEPAEPTTGGKTYSQDYVSTLRNESKNYRIRATASENALRSLFGLKEGEELGDLNARMTAYRQAQKQAQNDALEKVNGRLISSAINTMDGYDTKLLAKLIDRSKITVADDGTVSGLKEAAEAAAAEYPSVKLSSVPRFSRGTPGATETGDRKDQANNAIRSVFGRKKD